MKTDNTHHLPTRNGKPEQCSEPGEKTQVGKRGGQNSTPRKLDDPERVEGLWSAWFVPAEPQDQAANSYTGSVRKMITRPQRRSKTQSGAIQGRSGEASDHQEEHGEAADPMAAG